MRSRKFNYADTLFTIGYGRLSKDGKNSNVLMQLQVPVVNNRICQKLHLMVGASKKVINEIIGNHVICAGMYADEGTWKGDSGGPLMLSTHHNGKFPFYLIGIVSCSFACARQYVPGIYTKVQYYIDWIKENVEEAVKKDETPKIHKHHKIMGVKCPKKLTHI